MKPLKLFFLVVLLAWMATILFGCKAENSELYKRGIPSLIKDANDLKAIMSICKIHHLKFHRYHP